MKDIFKRAIEESMKDHTPRPDYEAMMRRGAETIKYLKGGSKYPGVLRGRLAARNEKAIDDWNRKCAEQEREKD